MPTRAALLHQLDRQKGYLHRSCALFDGGYEDEASRLAVTLRVLLHDTQKSHSLLSQVGVLDRLQFEDTSWQEPVEDDGVLVLSFSSGLVDLDVSTGRWVAPLSRRQARPPAPFQQWWKERVVVVHGQEDQLSRWDLIDFIAHQDGGAHVAPRAAGGAGVAAVDLGPDAEDQANILVATGTGHCLVLDEVPGQPGLAAQDHAVADLQGGAGVMTSAAPAMTTPVEPAGATTRPLPAAAAAVMRALIAGASSVVPLPATLTTYCSPKAVVRVCVAKPPRGGLLRGELRYSLGPLVRQTAQRVQQRGDWEPEHPV